MLIPHAPRALKMACGENPKRVYGNRNTMPASRMGIGLVLRQKLTAAAVRTLNQLGVLLPLSLTFCCQQELKQAQDQWDCLSKAQQTSTPRPFDLNLEPLVALLRGQINLNVHCYETHGKSLLKDTCVTMNG